MKQTRAVTRRDFLKSVWKYSLVTAGSPLLAISCQSLSGTSTLSTWGYDMVIKGGLVYDGSGKVPVVTDIGVRGDRVTCLGKLPTENARTIDATGCIVTPGFVDVHTHCDLMFRNIQGAGVPMDSLPVDFLGNYNYLFQGVTTVVDGNCGYGYDDMDQYYRILDRVRFGTNICYLVPHGMIRQFFFKDDQPTVLDARQLTLMKKKVAEEMAKGAFGLSTGLEYAPGCFSLTEELIEIAKVVREHGGIYATHIRNLTGKVVKNEIGIFKALDEAIQIGKAADVPVQLSHLQVNLPRSGVTSSQVLERIYKARSEGLDITGDIHSYYIGLGPMNYRLPEKFKTQSGIKDRYKTPPGRQEIIEAVEDIFTYLPPDKIQIYWDEKNPAYNMKFLSEIPGLPGNKGRTAAECYVDIVSEGAPFAYFHEINPEVMRSIIPQDHVFIASDGWTASQGFPMNAHPRSYDNSIKAICDYVLKEKLMDLQTAIKKMTSLPAEKFRIAKRGRIQKGYFADITVIDLGKLKSNATFENPRRYSEGIKHLLVNGIPAIEDGKATGQRAGRTLRLKSVIQT